MSTGKTDAHLAGLLANMATSGVALGAPAPGAPAPSLAQVVAGAKPPAGPGPPPQAAPAAAPAAAPTSGPPPQAAAPAHPPVNIQVGALNTPPSVKFVINPVGPLAASTAALYAQSSSLFVPGENEHLNSGVDIRFPAAFEMAPGAVARVPLGVRVRMLKLFWGAAPYPCGMPWAFDLRPRSSITKPGARTVILANSPGLVDAGYTGELMACLINLGPTPVRFEKGDSVVQVVATDAAPAEYVLAPSGSPMEQVAFPVNEGGRGASGAGSTGEGGAVAGAVAGAGAV